VNVDAVGLRNKLVVPHLFEQHCTGQQLILPTHHVLEQTELAGRQIIRAARAPAGVLDQIKLEGTYSQHGFAGF
jgi:hypothetical protein